MVMCITLRGVQSLCCPEELEESQLPLTQSQIYAPASLDVKVGAQNNVGDVVVPAFIMAMHSSRAEGIPSIAEYVRVRGVLSPNIAVLSRHTCA